MDKNQDDQENKNTKVSLDNQIQSASARDEASKAVPHLNEKEPELEI